MVRVEKGRVMVDDCDSTDIPPRPWAEHKPGTSALGDLVEQQASSQFLRITGSRRDVRRSCFANPTIRVRTIILRTVLIPSSLAALAQPLLLLIDIYAFRNFPRSYLSLDDL